MNTKIKYLTIAFLLMVSAAYGQVRIADDINNTAALGSSAFIDASSNTVFNSSTNKGKGLLFPRVDLTTFTSFGGSPIGIPTSYPNFYDGFIVYNTATTGVAGVGATQGTLSPGFWYYENKTTTVTGGTWKHLGSLQISDMGSVKNPGDGVIIYDTIAYSVCFYDGTKWINNENKGSISAFSQFWSMSGNSGTTNSNFIGTTDSQPLIFKVNSGVSGYTGYGDNYNVSFGFKSFNPFNSGWDNTALGAQTLTNNSTGIRNVAIGSYALDPNSTGQDNVAIGESAAGRQNGDVSFIVAVGRAALMNNQKSGNTAIGFEAAAANTSGEAVTAIGYKSLDNNTTGNNNSGIGFNALINNTEGFNNTAIGAWSLVGNTTGNYNTAAGMKSLFTNTTGEYNTALGEQALELNTTGGWNVGLGSGALNQNATGSLNTAVGTSALWNNTTGHDNTATGEEALAGNFDGSMNTAVGSRALWSHSNETASSFGHGSNNTALGYEALREVTSGSHNVGIGVHSLWSNTEGGSNVSMGNYALINNTTGNDNVAMGSWALSNNATGSGNTAIGSGAGINQGDLTNATAIGFNALATASNQIRIGNSDVISIGGYVPWSNLSDGRAKTNIRQDVPGLAFIKKLKPVTYNLDLDAADKLMRINRVNANDSLKQIPATAEARKARAARQKKLETGFVAQDVESAAKSIGYEFSGVDVDENGVYGLRYSEFVVPLVKAVQELSDRNDAKDAKIDSLLNEVEKLRSLVDQMQEKENSPAPGSLKIGAPEASLEQNTPNPFNQTTVIRYVLLPACKSARIVISSVGGKALRKIPLSVSGGANSITIQGNSLSSGVYLYTLICDGKAIDTKRMILKK